MSILTLHYHPLSSCCWKVLIAVEVLGAEVDARLLSLGDAAEHDAFVALWPIGKMPLLDDAGRVIPETSIIIEYLQQRHPQPAATLIPDDARLALQVRLWDRLMDLYVMTPMQALTADLLTPEGARDAAAVARARATLSTSYELIERQLAGRTWLAGETFSLADCAAVPALFYAATYVALPPDHTALAAYFERLVGHPAVAQVLARARPFFRFYPGRAGLARRFFDPAQDG